jgi:hypothetical protein
MAILMTIFMLIFSFGGFYYNGRSLELHCQAVSSETLCDYEIKLFSIPLQSGKNEKLLQWNKGKYSLHLYFQNNKISIGFIGNPPSFTNQYQYQPFSIWVLWFFCFIPCAASFMFAIYFIKEPLLKSLNSLFSKKQ